MHMRWMMLVSLLVWPSPVWAKTLRVPKGTIQVNQLHDELLTRFPEWRGTRQPDGTYADPLLGVEHTAQEITLRVPEDTPEASVQAVITAHAPKPPKDVKALKKSAKKKLQDLGLTKDEVEAILSD